MKAIEEILDLCIAELERGKNLDEVLAEYPEQEGELKPLLEMSQQIQSIPDPHVSINDLVYTLTNNVINSDFPPEIDSSCNRTKAFPHRMIYRFAASIAVILSLGVSSTVASSQTVPGDLMYPVKRMVEKVRLFISLNPTDEVELRVVFSEKRLSEALKKYNQGKGLDDELLKSMILEAKVAMEQSLELSAAERSNVIQRIGYMTAYQKNVIDSVEQKATEEERQIIAPIRSMCWSNMEDFKEQIKDKGIKTPSCSCDWCSRNVDKSTEKTSPKKTESYCPWW